MEVGSGSGKYRITGRLGQGAMGEVYRARQESLGRDVAIKILRPRDGQDLQAVERFLREARLTARLAHPNLMRVYDVGESDGRPYLVMELLEGRALKDHAQLFPRSDVAWKMRVVREVTKGLAYLHAQGIIHRDLKPANVMIDDRGGVKVCDFGLAYAEWEPRMTAQGVILGTLKYMAPESFANENPTPASDMYALGLIAYWFLLDRMPYNGTAQFELIYQIQHAIPAPPSTIDPSLPKALDAWVLPLLEKDPKKRPGAGRALADLEILLTDLERPAGKVRASGPPPPSRMLTRLARRYWYALAGALGLTAFALGLTLGKTTRIDAPRPTPSVALAGASPSVSAASSPSPATPLASFREILPGPLGIPLEMLLIPAGKFRMGAVHPGTGMMIEIQRPVHEVRVEAFYLGKFEVTDAQFEAVMQRGVKKPRRDFPVMQVKWPEAVEFCEKLSTYTGRRYRLPSEAEWEYACRAGTETVFFFGNEEKEVGRYGYVGDFMMGIQPIGKLEPNPWGLHDVYGNVWEWCADDFHPTYEGAPLDAKPWIDPGKKGEKVLRGGGVVNPLGQVRSSARMPAKLPTAPDWGFRVACDI